MPPLCKGRWHFRKKMTEGLSSYELRSLYPNNLPVGYIMPPLCKGRCHFRKKMTEGLLSYELRSLYPNNPPVGFAGPLYTSGPLNKVDYFSVVGDSTLGVPPRSE